MLRPWFCFRLVYEYHRHLLFLLKVVNGHQTAVRFESMQASMDTIQSALSEFLDDQRSAFPRLYFVGDTDLLEMLANAHRPESAIPHLSKMFAGISSLLWSVSSMNCFYGSFLPIIVGAEHADPLVSYGNGVRLR